MHADTITYFCTVVGIFRSGCTAFLISTRNTAPAIADMLSRTGATHLLVSPDDVMGGVADEALKSLADLRMHVDRLTMPLFEDLFPKVVDPESPFEAHIEFPASYDMEAAAVILHSSGKDLNSYIQVFSCADGQWLACHRIDCTPEADHLDPCGYLPLGKGTPYAYKKLESWDL